MVLPATRQWYLRITTVVPCEHCMEVALVMIAANRALLKEGAQNCSFYNFCQSSLRRSEVKGWT